MIVSSSSTANVVQLNNLRYCLHLNCNNHFHQLYLNCHWIHLNRYLTRHLSHHMNHPSGAKATEMARHSE